MRSERKLMVRFDPLISLKMQSGKGWSKVALAFDWQVCNKIFNNYLHRMGIILKKGKMEGNMKVGE